MNVLPACVSTEHMHIMHIEARRVLDPRVQELQYFGPLEERQVLLTTVSSLQPQTTYFILSLFIENRICHIINSDYGYQSPNSSLFLPTSPGTQIHTFCSLSLYNTDKKIFNSKIR